MNKKYLNSVLIILLIIIWVAVFYKYFGAAKAAIKTDDIVSSASFKEQNYVITKDTFLLNLTNIDPFKVSRNIKRKQVTTGSSKPKKITKPKVKKRVVWPTITYHGFVKGENKNTRLILLKIDNRLYRKREKEVVNDITLVKSYNDSLIVTLNNNRKTINKQ